MTDAGGRFLHELSMIERAQPHGLIVGITMGDVAPRVQCVAGPTVTIPVGADRSRITELLSEVTGPLVPPFPGEPQTYPDAPTPEQLWAELLDDLGAYLPDLPHADPHLRLVAVHRQGLTASIHVTNRVRQLVHTVPLDSQEMPAAVTVDIARVFPTDSAAAS
ncbi:hypothetical protein [Kocuria sp. U4B]